MGAINWIDSNPTTAVIHANEARDAQQAQIENQLLAARDQRRAAADADRNSALAANAMLAKPQRSALETATPAALMYDEMGNPVPATELAKATPGATIPQAAPKQSALSTVTADDPYARVNAVLQGQRGAGAMLLQNAQAQQKQNTAAHAEAIKAFGTGDFELAQALNQKHGLGLDAVFNNPSALQTSRMLAGSIQHLKLEPAQSIAYMDAATQKFAEVYGQTRDPKQAMGAAGAAGMSAAKLIRPKGTGNLVETPDGYFNRDTGDYERGKDGKVLRVPDRKLHFNVGGGSGDKSTGAKYDVDGEGNRIVLYRDGTMIYPKDKAGNPVKIKAGTDVDEKFIRNFVIMSERNRFPEQGEDPVARARDLARQTKTGTLPAQPAKPRIRFDANGNQIQ